MTQVTHDKLLSAKEAAELTGLNPSTLRKLAWQRKIRSFKVLGALRFKNSDLEALIVERPALKESSKGNEDEHETHEVFDGGTDE